MAMIVVIQMRTASVLYLWSRSGRDYVHMSDCKVERVEYESNALFSNSWHLSSHRYSYTSLRYFATLASVGSNLPGADDVGLPRPRPTNGPRCTFTFAPRPRSHIYLHHIMA